MNHLQKYALTVKELGFKQIILYSLYHAGIKSGIYRRLTPQKQTPHILDFGSSGSHAERFTDLMPTIPDRQSLLEVVGGGSGEIISEADEVLAGRYRIYGGKPAEIDLCPQNIAHWSACVDAAGSTGDIKDIWEPCRFGWAFSLARAYQLTQDDRYAECFWDYFLIFENCNPLNTGPNWSSGQEVAMRLLAFTFLTRLFLSSPASTPRRLEAMQQALFSHANRIPPTLLYARAQNNNHLLLEAAGLITAGLLFPDFAISKTWIRRGWKTFHQALQDQFQEDGIYVQQSVNYHRLALQAALWVYRLGKIHSLDFPLPSLQRLAPATRWLAAQCDPATGHLPNLGHHDGAYWMPLAGGGIHDYRPVIQSASLAFCGQPAFLPGAWDEMALWLSLPVVHQTYHPDQTTSSPAIFRLGDEKTWGFIRAVEFDARPAHADQLHVDLWWQGINIALDPGTFRYTAAAPWDNSLARTRYHNTVEIDGQDQMIKAGRFLWLRRAQARLVSPLASGCSSHAITAEHNGYQPNGVIHRRRLRWDGALSWEILDELLPTSPAGKKHSILLNWLLPDSPWALSSSQLTLELPPGKAILTIDVLQRHPEPALQFQLVRAGEIVSGDGPVDPCAGWFSPTYGCKTPALAFRLSITACLPLSIVSTWSLTPLEERPPL